MTPRTPSGLDAAVVVARIDKLGLTEHLLRACEGLATAPIEVASGARSPRVVLARARFWQALRDLGWSYPEIGALCDRDHSTVVAALARTRRDCTLETLRGADAVLARTRTATT